MTTDDHRQPSTTNYRPNFRSTIGRRPVADQSQTNCQSLADRTPTEFQIIIKIWNQLTTGCHSMKSTIGRQPFGDRSPTNWCRHWCRHRWLWFTLSFLCIRGTKAWQIYAYQPETSVVSASLAVQGMIRIANEKSNCIISSFVILIILLTARLIKGVSMLCMKFSHPLFS